MRLTPFEERTRVLSESVITRVSVSKSSMPVALSLVGAPLPDAVVVASMYTSVLKVVTVWLINQNVP